MIISYAGTFFLWVCFLNSLFGFFLLKKNNKQNLYRIVLLNFYLCSLCLALLLYAFYTSEYQLKIVASNSHHMVPLIFKFTALWGNHEGSLLLFTWMFFTAQIIFLRKYERAFFKYSFSLSALLLLSIIYNSSPFLLNNEYIKIGKGFNPLLQDIAIAFHPPILYFGNALQLVIFCLILARQNFKHIYIINYLSWVLLTLGISLGSWWAYRELGWGGIWFWDPVENISLLPWLTSTIIFHQKRSKFLLSYKIISCLSSISFILGMMLLRSGVVTSVHSFAYDPSKGIFLFLMFVSMCFMTFGLKKPAQRNIMNNVVIDKALATNKLILLAIFSILLFSILFPVFYKIFTHNQIELSKEFFVNTLSPTSIAILASILFFTSVIIKRKYIVQLIIIFLGTILGTFILIYLDIREPVYWIIILLSTSLITYSIFNISQRKLVIMNLSHGLIALLLCSFVLHHKVSQEESFYLEKGKIKQINSFTIELKEVEYSKQDNYLSRKAILHINSGDAKFVLSPETRFYPIENMFTIEPAKRSFNIFSEIYVTCGDLQKDSIMLEFQLQYLVNLIWLTAISIVTLGAYSCLNRFSGARK